MSVIRHSKNGKFRPSDMQQLAHMMETQASVANRIMTIADGQIEQLNQAIRDRHDIGLTSDGVDQLLEIIQQWRACKRAFERKNGDDET